jgi:hypothetical protein
MHRRIKQHIVLLLLAIVAGCAQQGAPTGGPKDEDPPKIIRSEPPNYSTRFSDSKFEITFDEFIRAESFAQEMVVSPPMEEQPVIRLKNKTLIVEFEEGLKENTTYTFNFGEAIKDLNESNVLLNYEYVFSTGDHLDSLSVKGTLKNAFDLTVPEGPVSIMLYNRYNDSLPLKEIPYYIGRADKQGNFSVNNLRKDRYRLFVLTDGNNNFIFDQQTESIAFLDSILRVDATYFKSLLLESGDYDSTDFLPDTTALTIDTLGMSADSIAFLLDSLERIRPDINSVYVDLMMFTEDDDIQFITDYNRDEKYKAQVVFNIPLTDRFDYQPLLPEGSSRDDYIEVFGKQKDTLTIWMPDSTMAGLDTVSMKFDYMALDSLGEDVLKSDTLLFIYRETTKTSKKKSKEAAKDQLDVVLQLKGSKQDIYKPLTLALNHPLSRIDTSRVDFFRAKDTLEIPVKPGLEAVPGNILKARLPQKWQEETTYRLVLYPGALTDVYMLTHDTLDRTFTTTSEEDYGKIILSLSNVTERILIQIYLKETIVRELPVEADGVYTFDNLDPETYRIKFIYDRNRNGRWDTGKYIEGRQPERVEFLPKDISVRSNWEHDTNYEMGSSSTPPSKEKAGSEETETLDRPINAL